MQLWHGTTDTTLAYPNFGEQIKQWTNLNGAEPDSRRSPTTRSRPGLAPATAAPGLSRVEGISIAGVPGTSCR